MAEIKSAIELAMEKTKNLVVDPKEREAMAIKEIEDKVKAVLRRYAEAMIDSERAVKELERIQGDTELRKTIIFDTIVDEFDVHKNNDRLFLLFDAIGMDIPQAIHGEFEMLNKRFRKELEAQKEIVEGNIRNILAEFKITGNALEANLDAWEEWHKEVERTSDGFQKSLETLKDKIRAAHKSV